MPNVQINIATATSFTNGEVIRYAKVTPNGIPPFTKPINNGIDEQEQNGVIAPNSEAKKYCKPYNLRETRYSRRRSIGKYALIMPMIILIRSNSSNILIVS